MCCAHSGLVHNLAWFSFIVSTLGPATAPSKGVNCQAVSQDGHDHDDYCAASAISPDAAVVVATFPMPAGLVFDWHTHDDHQLAWAARGVLTARTAPSAWALPPRRARGARRG